MIETFTLFRYIKYKQWSELFVRQRMNRRSTDQRIHSIIIPFKFRHILVKPRKLIHCNISICIEMWILYTVQDNIHIYYIPVIEQRCIVILITRLIHLNCNSYISHFFGAARTPNRQVIVVDSCILTILHCRILKAASRTDMDSILLYSLYFISSLGCNPAIIQDIFDSFTFPASAAAALNIASFSLILTRVCFNPYITLS